MSYEPRGTTTPIPLLDLDGPRIAPGEGYFWLRLVKAQAAFEGSAFERAKNLVVTSDVSMNHPLLGDEPRSSIELTRQVKRRSAEQLGIQRTIVELSPASMDRVTLSIAFLLDREDRLRQFVSLINDKSLVSVLSLAPGAVAAANALSTISRKLLDAFLPEVDRRPILQFAADLDVTAGLAPGLSVILGSVDRANPLPLQPNLSYRDDTLFDNGRIITNLSYVVLELRTSPARTVDLAKNAAWYRKLLEVERIATDFEQQPFVTADEAKETWRLCDRLLREARALIDEDPRYLPSEVRSILADAWSAAKEKVFAPDSSFGTPPVLDPATRELLTLDSLSELDRTVEEYRADVRSAQVLLIPEMV